MVDELKDNVLFQSVFHSSVEGILVVNDKGVIIKANPASERMFGYDKDELIQREIENLIPKEFRKNHVAQRTNYSKNPKARRMGQGLDLWGLKKNGSQFPLEISLSPTEIDKKKVVIAFVIDTTERRAAKQALLISESRMAEAQRIAHVGNWYWHLQTNERSWSDEFYRICGLPPGDKRLNKETVTNFIHPEDRENATKAVNLAIENRTPFQFENRVLGLDGTIRHIIAKGKVSYDEKGEPLEMLGTIQDITKQKKTENELKDSEERNRVILEVLPDVMFVLNNKGEYLDLFAPQTEKLLKLKEELIGKNIKEILPPEAHEAIKISLNTASLNKKPQLVEYSLKHEKEFSFYEARVIRLDDNRLLTIVRDITSKKLIDNTLSIRNRALSAAFNAIVISDAQQPDFPIIYTNEAFSKMTGYDENEVLGKNCRFLQNNDLNQKEIGSMSNAMNKGEACNVVLRNYTKDGSQFWNEISLTPIFNDKRILTHYIGVLNDVTKRKKEEFFKVASKYVMDMIIQQEPLEQIGNKIIETIETAIPYCMGSILLLNKKSKTLHKLSAPNLPIAFSKAIEGIVIGKDKGSCGTSAYLKKDVIVTDISKSSLWKDYKKIALSNNLKACWSFPIFSSDKEVLGTFAIYSNIARKPFATEKDIIQDITRAASVAIEQHNRSNALKQSTEKLAAYAEQLENKVSERTTELNDIVQKLTESNLNLQDQIYETKVAENKALRSKQLLDDVSHNFPRGFISVVDLNYKIVFMEGEELDDLGFKNLADKQTVIDDVHGVSLEIKAKVKNSVEKTIKGEHLSFEIKHLNRYYLVNTTPLLNKENKVEQVLLVYNNITIQKKAEFEMFSTLKKEQELSELKSRFISMASHEFRTPLSAILSSAILIEKQNGVGKEEKRINYVSKIRSNVKNLVVILNDFLSLSKLQEGKVISQPVTLNLVDFSKSLIEEIDSIKKNGQIITLQCDHSPIVVYLDPKLLKHIIYNLVSNAIKYSEEEKEVTINISVHKQHVCIEIKDEGIGIPIEDQDNMFERFYRANNASNIQGTGLGLNIVKQYTELMGGTISFESAIDEGATFYIKFPLKK